MRSFVVYFVLVCGALTGTQTVRTAAVLEDGSAQQMQDLQSADADGDGKPWGLGRMAKALFVGGLLASQGLGADAVAAGDGHELALGDRVRDTRNNQVGYIGRLQAANGYTGDVRFDYVPGSDAGHSTGPLGDMTWVAPSELTHDVDAVAYPYIPPHHGADANGVPFRLGDRVRFRGTNQVGTVGMLFSGSGDTGHLRFDIDAAWQQEHATAPHKSDGGVVWLKPSELTHVDEATVDDFPYIPPHQGADAKGVPFRLHDKVRSKKTGKLGIVMRLYSGSGDTGDMRVDWIAPGSSVKDQVYEGSSGLPRLSHFGWLGPADLEHAA